MWRWSRRRLCSATPSAAIEPWSERLRLGFERGLASFVGDFNLSPCCTRPLFALFAFTTYSNPSRTLLLPTTALVWQPTTAQIHTIWFNEVQMLQRIWYENKTLREPIIAKQQLHHDSYKNKMHEHY